MQRRFLFPTLVCLIPILIAVYVVINAYDKYQRGEGGFKFGIDLAGGTILVYEVDEERTRQAREGQEVDPADFRDADGSIDMEGLATALKRRIDPAALRNVTIRPLSDSRIQIILPTGGSFGGKSNLSEAEVAEVKSLISRVGSLRFSILANDNDDTEAIDANEEYFREPDKTPGLSTILAENARAGKPPPTRPGNFGGNTYAWVELGRPMREQYGLSNRFADIPKANQNWLRAAAVRQDNPLGGTFRNGPLLFFTREFQKPESLQRPEEKGKKYEYFVLTRSSDTVNVGGDIRITARSQIDPTRFEPVVAFNFNNAGARAFYRLTSANTPDVTAGIYRQLAVILDESMITAPRLEAAISEHGQISGNFTQDEVDDLVRILKAGALPATLKPLPVSENTIGPTLGQDTIDQGAKAIMVSYAAILLFMMIYYRFAGLVATAALLANLLLTIAFMVLVGATFTLPGLAGLALTMGMAVDSNILIYERIREERDRGATLIVAIRNGYDRAFSTIIDTHLSSILTAIILYIVGNYQLKGFGVSLTAGLTISLFTTLYLTRLIFDFFVAKRVVTKLGMFRFFSRPNINFMSIRHYCFGGTVMIMLAGLTLFLYRGTDTLNVDFTGGTEYGGRLAAPQSITQLRDTINNPDRLTLTEDGVERVAESPPTFQVRYADGHEYTVALSREPAGATPEEKLEDVRTRASRLPDSSVEQVFRGDDITGESPYFTVRTSEPELEMVETLVSQLFRAEDGESLLASRAMSFWREGNDWMLEFRASPDDEETVPTSPIAITPLLDRRFQAALGTDVSTSNLYVLRGEEEVSPGAFKRLRLTPLVAPVNWETPSEGEGVSVAATQISLAVGLPSLVGGTGPLQASAMRLAYSVPTDAEAEGILRDPTQMRKILTQIQTSFNESPQPERLYTFDSTLAAQMRTSATYAILASWAAVLLYLWFRFGNWTFGLAAVICLIHDLAFTLGAIAVCHYLFDTSIGQALLLQDFKIDLAAVAALLTLVGYSVNDTIVVFDRIREVRGKSPDLTVKMINDCVNQTLSRTLLASMTTFLVVSVLYIFGGEGVHLFAFVMVIGVIVGTYSSIYIASPLLLILGEGKRSTNESARSVEKVEEAAV